MACSFWNFHSINCFSIFFLLGIKISQASADNKEQIDKLTALVRNSKEQVDTLSNLVKNSQKQIDFLQKIYIVTDSTNKSTSNLKELPSKLNRLGQTIDTLNYSLLKETKRLEYSYGSLNKNYDQLIEQQKNYLDKISRVVELTNKQINELDRNNTTLKNELNRRAKIELTAYFKNIESKFYLTKIIITNNGNIECDIENLYLTISNSDFVCPDSLVQPECFKLYKPKLYVFKRECSPRRVNQGLSSEIIFSSGCYFLSNNIFMQYKLTYTNKYENETIENRPKLLLE